MPSLFSSSSMALRCWFSAPRCFSDKDRSSFFCLARVLSLSLEVRKNSSRSAMVLSRLAISFCWGVNGWRGINYNKNMLIIADC